MDEIEGVVVTIVDSPRATSVTNKLKKLSLPPPQIKIAFHMIHALQRAHLPTPIAWCRISKVDELTKMHMRDAAISMRLSGASSSLRKSFHAGSVGAGVSSFGPIMLKIWSSAWAYVSTRGCFVSALDGWVLPSEQVACSEEHFGTD